MLRKLLYVGLVSVFGIIVMQSFSGSGKYPSGATAGQTGSPGDGSNCSSCHGGTVTPNTTGIITHNIPATGYVPGTTYTITVTVNGSGKKGFELSPQNATGTQKGTLMAGSNTNVLTSGKYITHQNQVTTASAVWSFQWVAPVAGSGNVTFYAAYVINKPNIFLTNVTVSESTAGVQNQEMTQFSVYPNPVSDKLNIKFSKEVQNAQISLYDLSGKQLMIEKGIGGNEFSADITALQMKKGVYVLVLNDGENQLIQKIIKE